MRAGNESGARIETADAAASASIGSPRVSVRSDPPAPSALTEPGRGVRSTWNYTLASLVFVFAVLDAILILESVVAARRSGAAAGPALIVLYVVAAVTQVRYSWFLRVGRGGGLPPRRWTVMLVVPAALAWVVGLPTPGAGLFAAIPLWMAITLIASLLPPARRWLVLAAGVAITLVHPLLATSIFANPWPTERFSDLWVMLFYSTLLPLFVLSSLWWWEIVATLDRHRAVAAELAVAQERLRFASDLHDIQGHHLQVIALKTELAERLLLVDPESAREHVQASRMIAKEALEETRFLIAGYRQIGLDQELENAREVLSAAGARSELTIGVLPADEETRRVLALVVREATTNILRHSEATEAWISVDTSPSGTRLTIGNDAPRVTRGRQGRAASTGLDGLRTRLSALGGSLDVSHEDGADRFELRAFVPAAVAEAPPVTRASMPLDADA